MNANFGILPELPEKIKDKKLKYTKLANRAIENINKSLPKMWQTQFMIMAKKDNITKMLHTN